MDGVASRRSAWIGGGALALATAIVVGIVVTGGGDDEPGSVAPSTARPGVIGDTELLPLPGITDRTPSTGAIPVGPEVTSSQQRSLFEAPSDTAGAAQIDFNDLDEAIRKLTLESPFRSTTRVEIGAGGFVLTVVAEPAGDDRYVLTIGGLREDVEDVIVVDLDRGTTTVRPASGRGPNVISNDQLAEELGAIDIEHLLQQLLLGPVRRETMPFATSVEAGPVINVATNPDPFGRRFTVVLPAAAIREWVPYVLGPTGEAPIPDDATPVRLDVNVSSQADIVRVSTEFSYGTTVQRIEHRIDWLPVAAPSAPTPSISATTQPPG